MSERSPGVTSGYGDRREHRAWYFYDWANSAYVTTTSTVLFGPYLTAVAKSAACPGQDTDLACRTPLHVLGVPIAPGSLALYAVTFATLLSAVLLPLVGAVADRSGRKRTLLAGFAWAGSLAAASLWFVQGTNWQLGVVLQVLAAECLGASLVVYDAILIEIAAPEDRDGVSSRGWALGYLGGGLLLAINLVTVSSPQTFGLTTGSAVRLSLLSAGVWWGAFTLVPFLGLRDRPARAVDAIAGAGLVRASFGQLAHTLRDLRRYPQTLLFLVAYLFYNDGVQTVISASSIFGQEELGLSAAQLMLTILVVQFVGIAGALGFGRLAARIGAWRTVLFTLVAWIGVVFFGFTVPHGAFGVFLVLATFIGLVLGGVQALSRSLFSQLVPVGREAEYFSLYQATERGTSWFGTLTFGLVYQVSGSYRLAIVVLVVFFVVGGALLSRVRVREGIERAGNPVPAVV